MDKIRAKIKDPLLLAEKREQILKGAVSVFKEKGYHKSTVRDIAKAAGVSMGSLYDCISTKGDVFYMFYDVVMSTFQKELRERVKSIHDPKQELRLAYRTLVEIYFSMEDEILFGWTEAKNMERKHLKEVLSFEADLINFFKGILDELKPQYLAESEDTNMAANFLVYVAAFGVLRRWSLKPRYSKEQIIDYLVDSQLESIIS